MARTSAPNALKAAKGFITENSKKGTLVQRDSGKRPIKSTVAPDTAPEMPKTLLTKREKELWGRIVAAMPAGVYTSLDESQLVAYIMIQTTLERIYDDVRDAPVMVEGSTGQPVLNASIKGMGELASKLSTLGAQLGLTPIARNAIAAPSQTKANKQAENSFFYPKPN